jgi:hypothetical protein
VSRIGGAPPNDDPGSAGASIGAAVLAGGVALVQAVLAAVGAANGGLAAAALNKEGTVVVGLAATMIGLALLVWGFATRRDKIWRTPLLVCAALAVLVGVTATAIAALFGPVIASQPSISASLTPGPPPVLHARVTATGIPRRTTYRIAVFGESIGAHGDFVDQATPPYLYDAYVGADSSGDIDTRFAVPVPVARYPVIALYAHPTHDEPTLLQCVAAQTTTAPKQTTTAPKSGYGREQVAKEGCVFILVSDLRRRDH